jgi:hypothetical protein
VGGCYAGMQVPEVHSWEYELHKLEAKDRIVFMTGNREAPESRNLGIAR